MTSANRRSIRDFKERMAIAPMSDLQFAIFNLQS